MLQLTPLRRFALAVFAACVSSGGALAAGPGHAAASPPPADVGDHLTVTVRGAGEEADGTFTVHCHPDAGSHPDVSGACRAVDRNTRWGKDAFAPVPDGTVCTARYGGPSTAHVTGRWAGRPVDTTFDRSDGCEIARWDRFVPLLPEAGRPGGEGAGPRE
ncbi:SSI family serine proteinase inhibitor [Streptomyces sp. NPDC017936]|uniref:SSI family serine proteinase inhibitor n=1 Tax=Streptomyces sp. NPDC017936 TaxID=3365016 RepID=UPI0037A57AD7